MVDTNIRRWTNILIQANIFNSSVNNHALSPIESNIAEEHIDWILTCEWIKSSPVNKPTSQKKLRLLGSRIKKSQFIYPTADIQQRNYPRLYPSGPI